MNSLEIDCPEICHIYHIRLPRSGFVHATAVLEGRASPLSPSSAKLWGCSAFLGSAAPTVSRRLFFDRKLQGVLRPLRDGADAQQPRGRPRKRGDREFSRSPEKGETLWLSRDFVLILTATSSGTAKRSKTARGAHRDRAQGGTLLGRGALSRERKGYFFGAVSCSTISSHFVSSSLR